MTLTNGSPTNDAHRVFTAPGAPEGERPDLHELVDSLAERTLRPTAAEDSQTASRIIVAANDAAERVLTEARAEAATLVDTAKTQTAELLRVAQELADRELHAERARVAGAAEAWKVQREDIATGLAKVQSSLATFLTDAHSTMESITAAMAGLTSEAAAPSAAAPVPSAPAREAAAPTAPPRATTHAAPAAAAVADRDPAPEPDRTPGPDRTSEASAFAMGPASADDDIAEPSVADFFAEPDPADEPAQRTSLFSNPTAVPAREAEPEIVRSGLFSR